MVAPVTYSFIGGADGGWAVDHITSIVGAGLETVQRLAITEGQATTGGRWRLHGTTSNERYTSAGERAALRASQEGLGRSSATCAALIPITKAGAWWDLAQDERRAILEDRSQHIAVGLEYLPAIARRLHHGRDIGAEFDFLTWFEFAPEHAAEFDELLVRLRATEEWAYVEREVEIRVSRIG
jgi:chlorite dismutase